jgi:hypothetical protein
MDDAGLIDAELDLACLDFRHRLRHVRRDGAGLRIGHEPARAQHFSELADHAHHVGGGDNGIELEPPSGNLFDELFTADLVRTRLGRFPLLVR